MAGSDALAKGIEKQKEILIVEDDVYIRNNLVEILEEEGYHATGVENGQEALNYLKAKPDLPSLILLDLMMPVMNGPQFRAEQEKDARIKAIPVVVVTAGGDAPQKAKQLNVQGWVKKPIEIDDLLKVVQTFSA
jgi:CheY-like chemotaxis protein